jgi:hypothetical protein
LDDGSVTLLQRAVRPYFLILQMDLARPCLEADAQKKRAEMILLGNLRMVAYEQARLQPVFERNLSYVPNLFRNALANSLGRRASLMHAYRRAFTRVRNATDIINEAFQIAASRRVFSMIVGTEDLSFGRDLPVPPPANLLLRNTQPDADRGRYRRGAFFPSELNVLLEPSVWAEWQRYDRSSGNGGRTAVNDWLRYGERMSFIVNAFRSRQQLIGLYDVPTSIPPEAAAPGAAPGAPTLRARPAPRQPGPLDQPLDLSLNTQQRLHDKFAEKRP